MPDDKLNFVPRVSISFTPEVLACLDALVERSGLDRSAVVALLVMQTIKQPFGPFLDIPMPPDAEAILAALVERRGG